MGKRGPRPTPTAILKARGSRRVGAETDGREPTPEMGQPADVQFHDEVESKAVFEQVCDHLDAMGVLARCDGPALERYCRMFVQWRRCQKFIEQYGLTYPTKDKDGNLTSFQQFPQVAIARALNDALRRMEIEFGLTPSARSRIKVPETKQITLHKSLEAFKLA